MGTQVGNEQWLGQAGLQLKEAKARAAHAQHPASGLTANPLPGRAIQTDLTHQPQQQPEPALDTKSPSLGSHISTRSLQDYLDP